MVPATSLRAPECLNVPTPTLVPFREVPILMATFRCSYATLPPVLQSQPSTWVICTSMRSSLLALTVSRSKKLRSTELVLISYFPIIQVVSPWGQNVCMWSLVFWFQQALIWRNQTIIAPFIVSAVYLLYLWPAGALPLFGNRTCTKVNVP